MHPLACPPSTLLAPAAACCHACRAGLLGLAAPLLVLLMDTANVYFYFNGLDLTGGLAVG